MMQQLLSMLRTHKAIDQRERDSIQHFLDVVPTLLRPCDEDAGPLHVTASAIVVDSFIDPTATVLHLHKRLNLWLQPGGHIEIGETPADAALREAHEETGLVVAHPIAGAHFIHVDVHPCPRGHTHFDVRYVVTAPYETPKPGPEESQDVKWFEWEQAVAIADDGLLGALLVCRAGIAG
ncbi:MAG: NUDIX domain-containing protein [Ilumatobacteraceae bacterium]|nr:NUDIX domain-containing protein [Ilumatobacteraceae bacterium]